VHFWQSFLGKFLVLTDIDCQIILHSCYRQGLAVIQLMQISVLRPCTS
jgi:hypothetical protein